MKRIYSRMIEETKLARFLPHPALECLIFLVLFGVIQGIQSAILIVPLSAEMQRMNLFENMMESIMGSGAIDIGGMIEGMLGQIEELTAQLLSSPAVMAWILYATVITIAVVLIYCKGIQKRTFASLGMIRDNAIRNYLAGTGLGLLFTGFIFFVLYMMGYVSGVDVNPANPALLLFFAGFVIQSFSEELLMRGYLMNSMAARGNLPVAIFVSALIFALLHVMNPGMTALAIGNIFLYGIIFALIMLITDDIWAASGLHFAWNFSLGCVFGGEVSGTGTPSIFTFHLTGDAQMTGGNFGLEGSAVSVVVFLLIIAALILILRAKTRKAGIAGAQDILPPDRADSFGGE